MAQVDRDIEAIRQFLLMNEGARSRNEIITGLREMIGPYTFTYRVARAIQIQRQRATKGQYDWYIAYADCGLNVRKERRFFVTKSNESFSSDQAVHAAKKGRKRMALSHKQQLEIQLLTTKSMLKTTLFPSDLRFEKRIERCLTILTNSIDEFVDLIENVK